MSELLKLAERCEQATGPYAELDEAIMDALHDRQPFVQLADAPAGTGYNSWIDESGRRTSAYRFTASLDAAMTLVPEGSRFIFTGGCDSRCTADLAPAGHDDGAVLGEAATPALALCAAVLRSREEGINDE